MKIQPISLLLPALLGGCNMQVFHRPAVSDAQPYVDALIAQNIKAIGQVQNELKQSTIKSATTPQLSQTVSQKFSPVSPQNLIHIKQLGSPGAFSLVQVHARNQELELLLYKVVPQGWKVNISADLKAKFRQKIRLDDNDQWPHVLDKILRKHELVALLEWQKKQISVAYWTQAFSTTQPSTLTTKPATISDTLPVFQSGAEEKPSPIKAQASPTPVKEQATVKTLAAPAAPLATPTTRAWTIAVGTTLKDALMLWSSLAACPTPGISNWTLQWETPLNYRIDAPLHFYGDFNAALNGVFSLYQHAQKPLYAARIVSQCLIRVNDKAWPH